jgi:hypothetical protein
MSNSNFPTPITVALERQDGRNHEHPHDLWAARSAQSLRAAGYERVGYLCYAKLHKGYRFDVRIGMPDKRSTEHTHNYSYQTAGSTQERLPVVRVEACSTAPGKAKRAQVSTTLNATELRASAIQKFEARCMSAIRALLG